MKIELSADEVKEILVSWVKLKMPWTGVDTKIDVHQLYHEGSLAAAIEIDPAPKSLPEDDASEKTK